MDDRRFDDIAKLLADPTSHLHRPSTLTEGHAMDAGRFDLLSRSLDARSRRGALRALGVLGAVGLIDRLGLPVAEAGKKKGRKRKDKKSCPKCTCPEPTVCPPRDPCPERTCCICQSPSPTPGCRFAAARTGDDEFAKCEAACGGPGTVASAHFSLNENHTLVCNTAGDACLLVGCPI